MIKRVLPFVFGVQDSVSVDFRSQNLSKLYLTKIFLQNDIFLNF